MIESLYHALITKLCVPGTPDQWKDAFGLLTSLTLKQRKSAANLARAQMIPSPGTKLAGLVGNDLPPAVIRKLDSFLYDPFSAGLLMTMLRLAPLPPEVIKQTYEEAVNKERYTMDNTGLPSRLNYNVFFGSPHESIAPGYAANPKMAMCVQDAIDSWIKTMETMVHYPKLSRKTTADHTATDTECLLDMRDGTQRKGADITQIDVEKLYHQTGIAVAGPCEMRQKWYPSGLTPRTYYCAGGEAFHKSKHLSKGLTMLADSLPCTERRSRVLPTRLRLRDSHHAFIYDLTSFTSNLHEQKYFLERLALYCLGVKMTVVDAWQGLIQKDLGQEICAYNHLNNQARYSMHRVYKSEVPFMAHHTAGFLGVYGNIATATFLHGCVMLQTCDDTDELNVAGDDGIKDSDDDDHAFNLLRYLGLIETSKTFQTFEEGCIHLKRPISQLGNRLFQGSLVLWPSLEYMVRMDKDVDPRYPFIAKMKHAERRDALSSSIIGFLTSLSHHQLEDWMVDVADSLITWCYSVMSLPLDGYVPQVHGTSFGLVAQHDRRFVGLEPKKNTIERSYQGFAKVSIRDRRADKPTDLEIGAIFESNSSVGLNYLEALGYVERERLTTIAFGEEGLKQLMKEYFEPMPVVFKYSVVQTVPSWLQFCAQ